MNNPKYCRHCYAFLPYTADACSCCGSHDLIAVGDINAERAVFPMEEAGQLMREGRYQDVVKLGVDSGFNDRDSNYLMATMLLRGKLNKCGPDMTNGVCYTSCLLKVRGLHAERAMSHLMIAEDKGVPSAEISSLKMNYVLSGFLKIGWILWSLPLGIFNIIFDPIDGVTEKIKNLFWILVGVGILAGLMCDYPYIGVPFICLAIVISPVVSRLFLLRDCRNNQGCSS